MKIIERKIINGWYSVNLYEEENGTYRITAFKNKQVIATLGNLSRNVAASYLDSIKYQSLRLIAHILENKKKEE